jgi:maltose O-acetyltransferase
MIAPIFFTIILNDVNAGECLFLKRTINDQEMTEKEKCAEGLMYNANHDEELIHERLICKDLCQEYNSITSSNLEERTETMKKIIGKTAGDFLIEQPFMCDYGYNIELGKNFYSNHNLIILDAAKVTFGDHVFIAPNCSFYTAGHPINATERNEGLEYAHPITIGNNVWIGGNVVVLPGVSIGDNSIIGAGSIVNKSIPENVIAVGNPCKVVKRIDE